MKLTSITPFRVITGHRFPYQSKARMRLLRNLPPICTVSEIWWIICLIFAVYRILLSNVLVGGKPLNSRLRWYWWRKFFKVKAVSATSGGHSATLTGVFDFQHALFILVFCGNHMPKTHRFCPKGLDQRERQTEDRQTDGLQHCLMLPDTFGGYNNAHRAHWIYKKWTMKWITKQIAQIVHV